MTQSGLGMANDWQGRTGDAWAREWRRTDRSLADLKRQLTAAIHGVAPERGTAIDLGCGAGETAIALAKAQPGLTVEGIDLSEELIAVARERGAGIDNLKFRTGDTAKFKPKTPADLFISRHGVMFFPDPLTAFFTLRRAAVPGAPIVFSCFADRSLNPWVHMLDEAAEQTAPTPVGYVPGPFAFADRDWTTRMLAGAGWVDAEPMFANFSYVAGAGDNPVLDARDFFTHIGPIARTLADAPLDRQAILLDRLAKALAGHESDGQITFRAAAWIWTARAGEQA